MRINDPLSIVILALALIISLSIHEASHAFAADQLGDSTARLMGRLTLNPIKHLDPAGTIALIASSFLGYGIGWGKPCPVNPNNLRRGPLATLPNGPLVGMALVALAGPVSNILQAIIGAQILHVGGLPAVLSQFVGTFIFVNVILAVFNMIPIPPLDGYRVLLGLLPTAPAYKLARLEPWGPGVLILIVFMAPGILESILTVFGSPILHVIVGTM